MNFTFELFGWAESQCLVRRTSAGVEAVTQDGANCARLPVLATIYMRRTPPIVRPVSRHPATPGPNPPCENVQRTSFCRWESRVASGAGFLCDVRADSITIGGGGDASNARASRVAKKRKRTRGPGEFQMCGWCPSVNISYVTDSIAIRPPGQRDTQLLFGFLAQYLSRGCVKTRSDVPGDSSKTIAVVPSRRKLMDLLHGCGISPLDSVSS